MRRSVRIAAVALVLVTPIGTACADDASPQPYDLVRALRILQDKIAHGDAAAYASQRALLAQTALQLAQVGEDVWKEPRNARAAIGFVLSGGDPRILRKVTAAGALAGIDDKLVQGALAYAEGRLTEAASLIGQVDARTLDRTIAGHIALIQAELVAKADPKKAGAFLDDARLLSPGTLIEEAALRRHVAMASAASDFDQFERLSAQYLRRFPNSFYAGSFRTQFAEEVVAQDLSASPGRRERLEAALANLAPGDRLGVYLTIAKLGTIKAKVEAARFAAANAERLSQPQTVIAARARLYDAAVLLLTPDIETALAALENIDGTAFEDEDRELLAAARSIAQQVTLLEPPADPPDVAKLDEIAGALKSVKHARDVIAEADQRVAGAGK